MKKFLNKMAFVLVLMYAALVIFAVFFSDRILFQPHPSSYQDTPEVLKITTASGSRISAFYLPNSSARFTLLVSHGNAEDLGDARYWLEGLRRAGFAVFAFDYEGYGTSQGTPSEKHLYENEEAAYEYLVGTLGVLPEHIIIFGKSVGSGPAVHIATVRPAAALILQSPFVSAFRVLTKVPLLPFDKFPNYRKIAHVHSPVLIIHGTVDGIIGVWHGQKLYDLANEPKSSFWVSGADHNDLESVAGANYVKTLQGFALSLQRPKATSSFAL
ncbi:MAG TPA: alpha/beta hydrolase [Candidatus Angelobacter sp.]|jgi:fermentation-respiration switch protein FrsA (DUF1100 family)|nr:alpha/beta hydrolase [Candidatus Angelobacter sp.]